MVSTVSWDDEVVQKTYCFDLDLTFKGHKQLKIISPFYNGCSTKRRGIRLCWELPCSYLFSNQNNTPTFLTKQEQFEVHRGTPVM